LPIAGEWIAADWSKAQETIIWDIRYPRVLLAAIVGAGLSVVRQESFVEFDFSVHEIVLMGRSPHKRLFQADTREDRQMGEEALARVGMSGYGQRSFFSLSGGEKQRVLIARALAQQAPVLVVDEQTNHLDVRYQLQVMDLVKKLGLTDPLSKTGLPGGFVFPVFCAWRRLSRYSA